jgi:hypothetical protein
MTRDLSRERLNGRIIETRGHRVILDADLADAYGVPTKALNQAVKRNRERFPDDFCFRLTAQEAEDLKSQYVTSSEGWGGRRRSRPLAFTEHGAIMAASVLNSPRAIQMSIYVVRAFLRLRGLVLGQAELASKLAELERRVAGHDHDLRAIIEAIRQLVQPPQKPKRQIGFSSGTR